jgi:hypothetical protein
VTMYVPPAKGGSYEIPAGVDISGLPPETLEALATYIEVYGSLPYVNRNLDLEQALDSELEAMAKVLDALQLHAARESPDAFVQYAFRHEKNNDLIENADHHKEWHEFFDANPRAILFAPVEHGKTQHVIGRVIFELGRDPNKRIAIVSNTADPHAKKILSAIRSHIESNPRVRAVFPHLRPSDNEGDPWGQTAITVKRDTIAKDPSVQSLGIYGPINGARLDGIVLDDILNFENTRTPEQIDKLLGWLDTEVFTRVGDEGWIHWIGTPWNPLDPMHVVAKRPAWQSRRYCAVHNPKDDRNHWRPIWPQSFSVDRLKRIYDGTTPTNFARKYLCEVRSDEASRFQQAWIDHAKMLGRGRPMVDRQPHGPDGQPFKCYTGVDLGIGQGEGHDLSVIFTIAVDNYRRKVVCEVQAGRWPAPEIVQRIRSTAFRFNSRVFVEDNQAQAFIVQWLNGDNSIPVTGFTTSAAKKFDEHYGVESLAVELRNGGWVIPCDGQLNASKEVEDWIQGMLFYTPDSHTSDHLMAAWFARECARAGGAPIFRTADTVSR